MSSIYGPLDISLKQIRLVTFEQDHGEGAQIRLSMETVSLLDQPSYEALSYCWGSSDETDTIYINGAEAEIRPNLMTALRQFKRASNPTRIWIDSLCINQADVIERNQQVSMMGDIYRQACIVRIWLGTATYSTERGLKHLQEAASAGHTHSDVLTGSPTQPSPQMSPQDWLALKDIFSNQYWQRRWILQEVVLAHSISLHCGAHAIDFASGGSEVLSSLYIYASMFWKITSQQPRDTNDNASRETCIKCTEHVRERTLPFLISPKRRFGEFSAIDLRGLFSAEASDEHDYVYGMLGLFPPDFPVMPDYGASIGSAFGNFAFHFMHYYGSLRMLHLAGGLRTANDLPSWVPDFRNQIIRRHAMDGRSGQQSLQARQFLAWYYASERQAREHQTYLVLLENQVKADGGAELYISYPSEGVLELRAILVDRISMIRNSQVLWKTNHEDFLDHLIELCGQGSSSHEVEEFAPAYCAGLCAKSFDSTSKRLVETDIPLLARVLSQKDGTQFDDLDASRAQLLMAQISSTRQALTLFATERGRLGRGTNSIRPGDSIVIVAGFNLPMCLRPIESEHPNAFKLVGTAYVHGIMDGEAVFHLEQDLSGSRRNSWEDIHLL